jgi:hypothetical protein
MSRDLREELEAWRWPCGCGSETQDGMSGVAHQDGQRGAGLGRERPGAQDIGVGESVADCWEG